MNRTHLMTIAAITLAAGIIAVPAQAADPAVLNIDSLLSVHLLGETQEMRSDKIAGDSLSSIHLTQVRAGVDAQRHLRHHETVWIVRGAGRLTLDGVKHKVAAGTVLSIPPGTPHSFHSMGKIPAVVISVFSPGFDGKDRVYEKPQGELSVSLTEAGGKRNMQRLLIPLVCALTLATTVLMGDEASGQTRLNRSRTEPPPVNPSQFTVARLHYPGGGDWYWGASALPNLLTFLRDEAGIPASVEEVRVKPSDDNLFNYPFMFSTGHGSMRFSDDDITAMRRYLTGGGFWLINDSYGMDKSVRRELGRIFPDRKLVELPFSHPIYHEPYEFPDGPPKIHEHDGKPAQGYAILDGDRVVVFYVVESDIGDGWEDPQVHKDPPERRLAALRMGANVAAYALTH